MNKDAKIYVAGHTGLVGSALMRGLERHGYTNIITRDFPGLDLINQQETELFFAEEKPEYVFLAAARVGGIMANNIYRADFIYDNIQIQNNVIHFSWKYGVKKLLFLGSSCIYPKNAPQPLKEEYLLTSELEYTNEPYAIAKIAGIKMCEAYNIQYGTNFIAVMPTNLYGPGDNYNLEKSHVLPALIRKFHLGKCLENDDWEGLR
jgi:GDP-L-fucose synthase